MTRVLVAGWVGSTNLGDELVLAGVLRSLRQVFGPELAVAAVSIDPAATRRTHGVATIDHRRPDVLLSAARSADLVVIGGGGLIQDETSPFNLPYHLSRAWLATLAGTPWIGLALGVGRLETGLGTTLARTLSRARAVTVRDEPSLALLEGLGVPATLAADAAFHLATGPTAPDAPQGARIAPASHRMSSPPEVEVDGLASTGRRPDHLDDVLTVSLRPWAGPGGLLPVGWRRSTGSLDDAMVAPAAAALDRAADRTGLTVRFVALQTDRDAALHAAIAARMRTPTQLVVPDVTSVLEAVGRGRVVVAMRYHAAVAATLAGRPSVLLGYSPKVDALAATLGIGARLQPVDPEALAGLDEAIVAQLDAEEPGVRAVVDARDRLLGRAKVNLAVLRAVTGGEAPSGQGR